MLLKHAKLILDSFIESSSYDIINEGKVDIRRVPCNTPMKSTSKYYPKMVKACENGITKVFHYGFTRKYKESTRRTFRKKYDCYYSQYTRLDREYWICRELK